MYTPDDDSKMDGKMMGKKHKKKVYKTICVFRRKNYALTLDLWSSLRTNSLDTQPHETRVRTPVLRVFVFDC